MKPKFEILKGGANNSVNETKDYLSDESMEKMMKQYIHLFSEFFGNVNDLTQQSHYTMPIGDQYYLEVMVETDQMIRETFPIGEQEIGAKVLGLYVCRKGWPIKSAVSFLALREEDEVLGNIRGLISRNVRDGSIFQQMLIMSDENEYIMPDGSIELMED